MDFIQGDEEVFIPGIGGRPPRRMLKKDLVEIIQPRVSETLTMVKEKIEQKGYLKFLGGGVVLTGGGSLLPGITELAMGIFGLPVRIGYPIKCGGLVEEYNNPMFATGVGLVLYGAAQREAGTRIKIRDKQNVFKNVIERMKDWFKEFI
jgi:cell division protein FtsA